MLCTFTLDCGHATTADSNTVFTPGERAADITFQCWVCQQTIVGKVQRHWVTFAPTNTGYNLACRDCRYARTFGNAHVTALTKAASHGVRKHHTVDVRLDAVVLHTVKISQPSLLTGDAPPF